VGRWTIEQIEDVSVVTMTSNKVNALDDDFFSDLQAAIAELQSGPALPVVLTGTGRCFSAGLNLLELYEYDETTLTAFVDRLGETLLAWFSLPRPTVAAVNGHAIAGGCILALACDLRIVAESEDTQIGLNEVQVGIPFPSVPFEIARHALSPQRLRALHPGGGARARSRRRGGGGGHAAAARHRGGARDRARLARGLRDDQGAPRGARARAHRGEPRAPRPRLRRGVVLGAGAAADERGPPAAPRASLSACGGDAEDGGRRSSSAASR
jgi:hypothetical protein